MSNALTKDAILSANDIERERVEVPEWGGYVWVRGMTGEERDAFEAGLVERKGKSRELNFKNMRASLVAKTVVNDGGERLFDDNDVKRLGQKSAAALDRLYEVATRLSGIGEQDVEDLTETFQDEPDA